MFCPGHYPRMNSLGRGILTLSTYSIDMPRSSGRPQSDPDFMNVTSWKTAMQSVTSLASVACRRAWVAKLRNRIVRCQPRISS